jgi:hypothetical protein
MIQEIRLYYESIEQANHFVLPMIHKALASMSTEIPVRLVKLKGNYAYYGKRVAPIFFWKKPDVLMTVVQGDKEYPILFIEFSTAVFTEDHELQRFDGLVTSARNECLYVKISPTKKESPYEHGGQVEFDYSKPFSLVLKRYNLPYFHFEWVCDKKGVVETDPEYPSCPRQNDELEWLIGTILRQMIEVGALQEWVSKLTASLQERPYLKRWIEQLESTPQVDIKTLNTSRTRWVQRDPALNMEVLELKFNRFGHAMDPERGMLAYYATLFPTIVSKMMFSEDNDAWYKDTPKEDEIRRYIQREGLTKAYDFLHCFALGSGLYQNKEFMRLVRGFSRETADHKIVADITEFVHSNFLKLSKPLKTILAYSALFIIEDQNGRIRVMLKWQGFPDVRVFNSYPEITNIKKRVSLDEDDVTYIAVHNILRKNGFHIIAVSYPGAQGDRRILVAPGTGRRQPREYIDIVSFLPKKVTSLQEDIGAYTRGDVQENIDNLSLYKGEQSFIDGFTDFQKRYAPESVDTTIRIGIGFWANRGFTASNAKELDLKDLDYFVYISSDRKLWKIWRTGSDNIFSNMAGDVSIPETYDLTSQNFTSSEKLANFS